MLRLQEVKCRVNDISLGPGQGVYQNNALVGNLEIKYSGKVKVHIMRKGQHALSIRTALGIEPCFLDRNTKCIRWVAKNRNFSVQKARSKKCNVRTFPASKILQPGWVLSTMGLYLYTEKFWLVQALGLSSSWSSI